jgi:hypothetical protein
MDNHRIISGAGQAMGTLGGEDAEAFNQLFQEIRDRGIISYIRKLIKR